MSEIPVTPVDRDEAVVTRAELEEALSALGGDIEKLAEIVAAALDTRPAAPAPGPGEGTRLWDWSVLTGQVRAGVWAELRGWVEWFNGRYGTAGEGVRILPCWPRHPVVVEELTALMVSWNAAHEVDVATDALIAWHDRWLWPCMKRIHEGPGGLKNCGLRSHDLRNTVTAPKLSDDGFDQFVREDVAAHPGPTTGPPAQEAG